MVQGMSSGRSNLVAPVATKSCGTFFAFMYFWIAVLVGVPSGWKTTAPRPLDQLARQLDRLRRAVAVVVGDEVDLAAVDAALVVDHLEVGGDRLADRAVGRGRPAVRHGVADLDLGVARARVVFLLRRGGPCGEGQRDKPARRAQSDLHGVRMCFLHFRRRDLHAACKRDKQRGRGPPAPVGIR